MKLFKSKSSKKKSHRKNHKDSSKTKSKKERKTTTNKYRITTEISLTGNTKNPLKSKMSGFFIKFSFKDDDKRNNQNQIKDKTKSRRIKSK